MKNLVNIITQIASHAIAALYEDKEPKIHELLPAEITQSTQKQFGHYQCNSCLKLSKLLRISPRELALEVCEEIRKRTSDKIIEKLEVAGPGFINIHLHPEFLSGELNAVFSDPYLGVERPKHRKKIIVEYSSPNIAKELHVGHLRSTIIGETLARLIEFTGHEVLRLNHVGDWGTQFGMLIAYIKKYEKEVLTGKKTPDLSALMGWYRESKKLFDQDEEFKKSAQEEVVELQSLRKDSLMAWEKICDISRAAFKEIYKLLDVSLKERGESFYNPMLHAVIDDLENKKMIRVDQGAKCVFLEGFEGKEGEPLPMIIQKSDGGYNYSTTDMAALKHRIQQEKAERIIYVVDAGQSLHFQMVFKAAEQVGYLDPKKTEVDHVAFGVVLGADGKKFKTRSGETEKLIDLLTKAVDMAYQILQSRMPGEIDQVLNQRAEILGIDAVKYADLSCHRLKDYTFSYERMLKFEGNTAAFLLYAFVRIQSIKQKIGKELTHLKPCIELSHPSEVELGIHIRQFGEVIYVIEKDLLPHKLCDYLYLLAEKFNAFFRDCRVEGSENEISRLFLCELTAKILEKGLYILGLKTLDKM